MLSAATQSFDYLPLTYAMSLFPDEVGDCEVDFGDVEDEEEKEEEEGGKKRRFKKFPSLGNKNKNKIKDQENDEEKKSTPEEEGENEEESKDMSQEMVVMKKKRNSRNEVDLTSNSRSTDSPSSNQSTTNNNNDSDQPSSHLQTPRNPPPMPVGVIMEGSILKWPVSSSFGSPKNRYLVLSNHDNQVTIWAEKEILY